MSEPPNALHSVSAPDASWSTINIAEAMPGVLTPLGWSFWGLAAEQAGRAPFVAMGALPRRQGGPPDRAEDRVLNIFYGRVAIRVDFLCRMGDLIPGTSGEGLARDVFSFVPPGFVSRPSKRRWPVCAVRLPTTFTRLPAVLRKTREETDAWWRHEIARTPSLDRAAACHQLEAAVGRFREALSLQATAVACGIQPVHEQLAKLAATARVDPAVLMTGHGSHEETAVITDLWAVSRNRMTLEDFLRRHGYHGPREGDLGGLVWREDAGPVLRLVEGYRSLDDAEDPAVGFRERLRLRQEAEAGLLASLGGRQRLQAKLLLRLAAKYLPLRGVGKVSFLQGIDVARAAARRIGACLAAEGLIDETEDVFFLTAPEVLGELPADARAVIKERRELRLRYEGQVIPACWTGMPIPEPAPTVELDVGGRLTGVAASAGVAQGRVCVVTDPADADVEPGDILVAHTTDPSWASVMFLAKALVVDIGGMLSHAAVVARELGIPCVMNTGLGTKALRSGDICSVDGTLGTVEILERRPA